MRPSNRGQKTPRRSGAAGPGQTRACATAKQPGACTERQKAKFAIQPCTTIGHPAGETRTKRRTRCGPRQPRAANATPRRRSRSAPDARPCHREAAQGLHRGPKRKIRDPTLYSHRPPCRRHDDQAPDAMRPPATSGSERRAAAAQQVRARRAQCHREAARGLHRRPKGKIRDPTL
jgi:hypothetical protein